jgi:exopolysaccharide biosynthesis polyprenyl glycosylphosphotransferase
MDGSAAEAPPVSEETRAHLQTVVPGVEPSDELVDRVSELDTIVGPTEGTLSRRDSVRRRLLAIADILGLAAAYGCVWLVAPPNAELEGRLVLAAALPCWVVLNKLMGLYDRDANLIHKSTLDELPRIALSIVLGTALVFLVVPALAAFEPGRGQTLLFAAFALMLVPLLRALGRVWVVHHFEPERCVIVGTGFVADLVARKIAMHPEHGVKLVGFIDVQDPADRLSLNGSGHGGLIGDLDRYQQVCSEFGIERAVIAFSSLSHQELIEVIRTSKQLNVKITVVPRLFEVIGHSVEVDQLEGMALLGLRGFSRTRSSLALKRGIDLCVSAVVLLLTMPFLLAMALAIKLSSKGPVLFAQDRIGRDGKTFRMYKLRTMVHGADGLKAELAHLNEAEGPMFKIANDPRVTPVGRVLRKLSLDELPQLWNVLRGEMSLVGPRPLVPDEDDHVIGYHRERLDLTPGLTGPWQVLGRTAIPFPEMVKLDYLYVAEWSLWNDIKLLIRTVPVVVNGRGA